MSINTSIGMNSLHRLLYSVVIACTGITATQATYADSQSNQGNLIPLPMLTFKNDEEKCTLSSSDNEQSRHSITLLLDTPCYWVTTQDATTEEPLSYSYPDKKIEAVMLAAGGKLDWPDEKKTHHKLPIDTVCSQYLQGVIISENEIYAVDTLMEAPHCKGLAVDEKVFQQAVGSKVRYKTTPPSLSSTKSTSQETDEQEIAEAVTIVSETKIEPKEDDSLLGSIQKTIKRLFTSDD